MNKDCTSLDVSIKLKEAGWKQDACAIAYFFDGSEPYLMDIDHWSMAEGEFGGAKGLCWKPKCKEDYHYHEAIAASTIGQLLEALPIKSEVYKKNDGSYGASTRFASLEPWDVEQESDNPADALALLWLALKEKGLIPTQEVEG